MVCVCGVYQSVKEDLGRTPRVCSPILLLVKGEFSAQMISPALNTDLSTISKGATFRGEPHFRELGL